MTTQTTRTLDAIEVSKGHLLIRYLDRTTDLISGSVSVGVHRESFFPGQNVSEQPPEIQAAAAEAWTPDVLAAYREAYPQPQVDLIAVFKRAVQAHLDAAAQALGYESIFTACTYADEPAVPSFQAEGQAFRAWRSLVWGACYTMLSKIQAGQMAPPESPEALIALLPALDLP